MKNGKPPIIRPTVFSSTHHFKPSIPPPEEQTTASFLSSSLQFYINSDHPSHGRKIHSRIIKTGFYPNTNISIKLLIVHLKSNHLSYARKVFDEMPQPTLTAYNYLISAYIKQGFVSESFDLVRRMVLCDEKPNGFTFSMILKASTSDSMLSLSHNVGKEVNAQILKSNIEADDVLYTALVDSYVKSRRVDYARKVFDLMLEKNVICSTSMITGYMNQGLIEEAKVVFNKTIEKDVVVFNAMIEGYSKSIETAKKSLELYIDMQRLGFKPTISTFASIIGACSVLSAFEFGQQIQAQLMKTTFYADIKIGSALIDMYSKCGRIEDARRVFDQMPRKNVFSWTSMIDGYGKNGHPNEALALFEKMNRENRSEPNHVTFLGALSACGHAGLVSRGREIFESMERDFSMKPKMEHYACMVDLLGRVGNLNQAMEFIIKMPESPNSDVWAALLSSCTLHGDTEMAKIAANELFKLNCDGRPGAYVALSNTLAASGRWESVIELREFMKVRGIAKDTAFTWIGNDDGLEAFRVGERRD